MGFFGKNSGETKKAGQAQERAYNRLVTAMDKADAAREQYRAGSAERMKGVKGVGERALGRLEAYDRGEDVASIHPMLAKQMGDISKNYQALTRMTGGMGTSALAQQDPRYMQKMQSVGLRDLAKTQGSMIASAGAQARERDLGEYINAQGSQIGEERFGLGLFDQGFNQSASALGGAGQWRSGALGEAQRQAGMVGNVMSGVATLGGAISDERAKSNIRPSKEGLDTINKLDPITYTFNQNAGPMEGQSQSGLSAQQVAKEVPGSATMFSSGLMGVKYPGGQPDLTAVMVKSIQELDQELQSLKKKKGKSNA